MRLAGLVLAGGRGSRMGGDRPKPLLDLGGKPLVAHVLDRMPPHASPILVSANNAEGFADLGLAIVADRMEGFAGPLAGLDAAAHLLAAHHPDVTHLLCLPGDTPFLPMDLAARLAAGGGAATVVASFRGPLHPAAAVWTMAALAALPAFLASGARASIRGFLDHVGYEAVEIAADPAEGAARGAPDGDPFFNVNTPADLDAARLALSQKR